MVAPSPPAPLPEDVPHPSPRHVWQSPCGTYRIDALDYQDARRPGIEIRVSSSSGRRWQPLSDPDFWPCAHAMALRIDELQSLLRRVLAGERDLDLDL